MKSPLGLFAVGLLFVSSLYAEDFTTIDGKKYQNVTLSRVEPDGLVVIAEDGILKIPFLKLSKEVQAKYGYDAAQAAEFSKAVAKTQHENFVQQVEDLQRLEAQRVAEASTPDPGSLRPDFPKYAPPGGALTSPRQFQFDHEQGLYFSADDLLSYYVDNALKGDAIFKNRRVTVRGTAFKFAKDSTGKPAAYLATTATGCQVVCVFANSTPIVDLHAGQLLYIYGKVRHGDQNEVKLEDCSITAYSDHP